MLALLLTPACQPKLTALEKVQQMGVLTVVTRSSPALYFHDAGNAQGSGFEYELAKQFAEEIGVTLVMEEQQTLGGVLDAVKDKRANLAAAGLSITRERNKDFHFTTPYQRITQRLIYRSGSGYNHSNAPKNISDLIGKRIVVMAHSSHAERLAILKKAHPNLEWVAKDNIDSAELIQLVFEHEFDFTIIDSNEFAAHQALMPELTAAFDIGEPESVAWAFDRTEDDSLYLAADDFLANINTDGRLEALKERFFGHINRQFNYVGARRLLRHMDKRLPEFEKYFKDAAAQEGLDWRLLAAVSYQESLWDPKAISPTGVRGLMMLTLKTAKEMNIANRSDPQQSIEGGAAYLKTIIKRIPSEITEPHRTWMALASYNAGYGHIKDARKITEIQGDDKNSWFDVKERLPLLQQPEYYKYTRFGYARGGKQAPIYVENIRRYYDVLVWATSRATQQIHNTAYTPNTPTTVSDGTAVALRSSSTTETGRGAVGSRAIY
ncbi:MAG: membrane-bound lytic murein transglycosylase MltF [Pseudomonadales bacterium]|nr:membrane-bound lytic murein transglycosylase MltF [Pseudomonadales bacterium]